MNSGVPVQAVLALNTVNVRDPVGLNPPDNEATSVAELGDGLRKMVEGDACVVIVGPASRTVSVSPLAPHVPADGLLLESPVYDAIQ